MAQQSNILNVIKAHHLRDAAGIIAVSLVDPRLQ